MRFLRATHLVIMCRSRKEAEEALERVRELTQARGLSLHPEKTRLVAVADSGAGFDFLGYHFEAGTRWPRKKSLAKLKDALRQKTRRSNGHSLATIIQEVNQTLIGWFGYFKHSRKWVFRRLDQQILSGPWVVQPGHGPSILTPVLEEVKPPTGEPDAGDPLVRFGGRGGLRAIPTPIGRLKPQRSWMPDRVRHDG